jgi:uncharacterized membrane protein YraQ (UPF0718 family)
MNFLRIWFLATAVVILAFFIWAYVPVVIPFLVIIVGLGGLTFVIVFLARRLERWLEARRR